mgnify:CR=1 FL=1
MRLLKKNKVSLLDTAFWDSLDTPLIFFSRKIEIDFLLERTISWRNAYFVASGCNKQPTEANRKMLVFPLFWLPASAPGI